MKNNEYCKRQFQLSLLRAQWWIASANSGHYKSMKIYYGLDGPEVTSDVKLEEAMAIAKEHIRFASECSEALAEDES